MKSDQIIKLVLATSLAWVLAVLPLWPIHAQGNDGCAADIIIQPGDTLSDIAEETLGDKNNYQAIVEATNSKAELDGSFAAVSDPNRLVVGWKLCIPETGTAETITATGAPPVAVIAPSPTQPSLIVGTPYGNDG